MDVKKQVHSGWLENEKIASVGVPPIFEKYQYIYSQGDNKISLIQFTESMYGSNCWEIYQTEGKNELFEDVERYASKEQAEQRIKELLK